MADLNQLHDAVEGGQRVKAEALTKELLAAGVAPVKLLEQALIPAMQVVGKKFSEGEYFVPEMLMAAKAMKTAMELLRPELAKGAFEPVGKVVLGTVRGDLHDIGKNLVKIMLEGAGFDVIDLGVDVAPDKFVAAVREHQPGIVAMSALLTTTMLSIPDTIQALVDAGLRSQIKVIIGGAAITENFRKESNADAYGADAYAAVEKAKVLLGKGSAVASA